MTQQWNADDIRWMQLALDEAARGQGFVEPNPMVGCVVTKGDSLLSKGFHRKYGGAHAEVDAIAHLAENALEDATVYVTLEPCSHFGKTPPCADFLVARKPKRVVIAMRDPFPEVSGRGIRRLEQAGIQVDVGLLESDAQQLNAPYLKLLSQQRPWVIAKWAMTLDGAIATQNGDSKWISNQQSRAAVHHIRSQVDAVITGVGTVLADDPMLNVRLGEDQIIPRIATRVVLDRQLRTPLESQLIQTASQIPVVLITGSQASSSKIESYRRLGVEIWQNSTETESVYGNRATLHTAMEKLGRLRATNVLIEAGARVLGTAIDADLVDQVECFIAPKILGGNALRPILGDGINFMRDTKHWDLKALERLDQDVWLRLKRNRSQDNV